MSEYEQHNPLISGSTNEWNQLIEAIAPAAMLVVIESRMSDRLRACLGPEDIWQEVLLQAWRDREKFEWRGVRSFRSWILTLIDHRIRDAVAHHDAKKRGSPISSGASSAENSSPEHSPMPEVMATTTPSRMAIYREQAAAMSDALASLASELRDVVQLRLFEQLTLEQIAEQLDTTLPTVRYKFARGAEQFRRRLRAQFSDRGTGGENSSAGSGTASAS